jgi:hypothetical protein
MSSSEGSDTDPEMKKAQRARRRESSSRKLTPYHEVVLSKEVARGQLSAGPDHARKRLYLSRKLGISEQSIIAWLQTPEALEIPPAAPRVKRKWTRRIKDEQISISEPGPTTSPMTSTPGSESRRRPRFATLTLSDFQKNALQDAVSQGLDASDTPTAVRKRRELSSELGIPESKILVRISFFSSEMIELADNYVGLSSYQTTEDNEARRSLV